MKQNLHFHIPDIFKPENGEKKVEFLELIYDLIFVYIIGRNNSLLHNIDGGFVSGSTFLVYILCSLAIIQIWNYSTFYTNMFGRNRIRDHVFMFINMYLLYYIGEGTRVHWASYQNQYHLAWALILINIGIQYLIEARSPENDPGQRRAARGIMSVLFGESILILISIPVYNHTGKLISALPIVFGLIATNLSARRHEENASWIDFPHLTERAMLYIVFTFGEMIIAAAVYFEGKFSGSMIYFSILCFLIIVGLFLTYEVLYNRIIDRERNDAGLGYMLIHIFLIFGLNNMTTSLEFMQDPEVALLPKTLLLIFSFLLTFGCMFALMYYTKAGIRRCFRFLYPLTAVTAVFIVLMLLLRENMWINILISVIYVAVVFLSVYRFGRRELK